MNKILSDGDRPLINPRGVFRKEDNGAYLFDPDTGGLQYVNAVGAVIYELCSGARTLADIVALVQETFPEADATRVKEDVRKFIGSLMTLKFLVLDLNGQIGDVDER